jgi:hypothetical protein
MFSERLELPGFAGFGDPGLSSPGTTGRWPVSFGGSPKHSYVSAKRFLTDRPDYKLAKQSAVRKQQRRVANEALYQLYGASTNLSFAFLGLDAL